MVEGEKRLQVVLWPPYAGHSIRAHIDMHPCLQTHTHNPFINAIKCFKINYVFLSFFICGCVCAGMCVRIHTKAWVHVMWNPVIDTKCLLSALSLPTLLVFERASLTESEDYWFGRTGGGGGGGAQLASSRGKDHTPEGICLFVCLFVCSSWSGGCSAHLMNHVCGVYVRGLANCPN